MTDNKEHKVKSHRDQVPTFLNKQESRGKCLPASPDAFTAKA